MSHLPHGCSLRISLQPSEALGGQAGLGSPGGEAWAKRLRVGPTTGGGEAPGPHVPCWPLGLQPLQGLQEPGPPSEASTSWGPRPVASTEKGRGHTAWSCVHDVCLSRGEAWVDTTQCTGPAAALPSH